MSAPYSCKIVACECLRSWKPLPFRLNKREAVLFRQNEQAEQEGDCRGFGVDQQLGREWPGRGSGKGNSGNGKKDVIAMDNLWTVWKWSSWIVMGMAILRQHGEIR